jgi:hypothetical protein
MWAKATEGWIRFFCNGVAFKDSVGWESVRDGALMAFDDVTLMLQYNCRLCFYYSE